MAAVQGVTAAQGLEAAARGGSSKQGMKEWLQQLRWAVSAYQLRVGNKGPHGQVWVKGGQQGSEDWHEQR
jgi:hypothetical protein